MRKKIKFNMIIWLVIIALMQGCQAQNTKGKKVNSEFKYTNHLITEQSPYLLQHAHNPVEWYPWGEEAFETARREDKPIFLSIGYYTCHWCHVMEHESFESPEVAEIMNKTFVCIKVDREERPDLDNVYMKVSRLLTGTGGWPLTIIMTPDKKPFYAGTYIPKHSMHNRIGLVELTEKVGELWKTDRAQLLKSANQITEALLEAPGNQSNDIPDINTLDEAYKTLRARYDFRHGGFSDAPKFPSPHNIIFLLRYWHRTGNETALAMAEKTLLSMYSGGMYDHIGFGFHRYSTDKKWFLPHFEKMLYDQAMLTLAYTEAYEATKNIQYKIIAEEIIQYVLRDMTSPLGGFYSAEDADSEGEEGKFYIWKWDEIKSTLNPDEFSFVKEVFNISENGNFKHEVSLEKSGGNVLAMNAAPKILAERLNISLADFYRELNSVRKKLFAAREKRVHPNKDDKILTDWNGLMIAALSKAGRVFNKPEYTEAAEKAIGFIYDKMFEGQELMHRFRGNHRAVYANADDFSFLIFGLINTYEASFNPDYLSKAVILQNIFTSNFFDDKNFGFYFTSDKKSDTFLRTKEFYDGAIPSSNSTAFINLQLLYKITANKNYENLSVSLAKAFSAYLEGSPISATFFLTGLDFFIGPTSEIVIADVRNNPSENEFITELRKYYAPKKIVIYFGDEQTKKYLEKIIPSIEGYSVINNKPTVFVCKNFNCNLPTNKPSVMIKELKK